MKKKILIEVDEELLSMFQTKEPTTLLSDVLEDTLASRLGKTKKWVSADASIIELKTSTSSSDKDKVKHPIKTARPQKNSAKNIWGVVGPKLETIFTIQEYIEALLSSGYEYAERSLHVIPYVHMKKLIGLNKIVECAGNENLCGKDRKFKKVLVPVSSNAETDRTLENLKSGKAILMGTIR